jgi:hypothetical protein
MKRFNLKLWLISGMILSLLWPVGSITAQDKNESETLPVLTFKELTRSRSKGTGISLDPRLEKLSIVDINSKIVIYVNKPAVRLQALKMTGSDFPPALLKRMEEITSILNKQANILQLLGNIDHFSREEREKNLNEFSSKMLALLSFLGKNPVYRQKANAALGVRGRSGQEYRDIYSLVGQRMEELESQLTSSYSGVRFRMGAWLRGKSGEHPVHIDGFDKYEQGEFYKYPFFTMPSSEEVQKQLNDLKDAANRFNTGGVSSLINLKENLEKLNNFLETNLKKALDCMKNALENAKATLIQNIKDLPMPQTNKLLDKVKKMIATVKDAQSLIKSLIDDPAQLGTQIEVIRDVKDMVNLVVEGINFVKDNLDAMEQEVKNGIKQLKADIKTIVQNELNTIRNTCFTALENFIETIGNGISGFFDSFSTSTMMLSEQERGSMKLGDKVNSLLIDNIPEKGVLDLRYTGNRADDDEIYIKAVLEQAPATTAASTPSTAAGSPSSPLTQVIAEKVLVLYKITYIKLKTGLIFANPFKKEGIAFTKKFQAAPSYSVMLKLGNRKSITWNRLFQPGIGINVSALDFNQDSTLEVGLGVVLSTFKDYLQVGVGRNMTFDKWYWFFGVNLPWGDISLPGLSTAEAK